jgi:hypothetical protein
MWALKHTEAAWAPQVPRRVFCGANLGIICW